MRIDILGSGTGIPSADRGPAGCVVAMHDNLLLIDSGSGSLSRLARQGLDYRRISTGLFTHCHVDHTAGRSLECLSPGATRAKQ